MLHLGLDLRMQSQVPVYCGQMHGIFLLGRQRVLCTCADCINKAEADREFSCTQFEQHAGAGAAKKWKASLRIDPASMPETTTKSESQLSDLIIGCHCCAAGAICIKSQLAVLGLCLCSILLRCGSHDAAARKQNSYLETSGLQPCLMYWL